MNFNKIFLLFILLTGGISGCMSSVEKPEATELETLRKEVNNRPYIIHGEKYRPCCMDISIIGQEAKNIFDKMPNSTLLTTPTKGTCLDGGVVKVSEGTMCSARESDLNNPILYSCAIIINYSTGTTEKINIDEYLNCDEED
ncbi:MAG: hypothetical protein LBE78_08985 [Burkholderiaceae bacterium]|jgi:hypothetical protein|nr:hypothetical protein [Burkholderiaceae bacterium]